MLFYSKGTLFTVYFGGGGGLSRFISEGGGGGGAEYAWSVFYVSIIFCSVLLAATFVIC